MSKEEIKNILINLDDLQNIIRDKKALKIIKLSINRLTKLIFAKPNIK